MKNALPVRYKIIRELIGLIGIAEMVLSVYVGYQFGAEATSKAWLFVGFLAIIGYISTRLWIWLLEKMRA